ncbi:helix-turn-helix domain-containing protein [Nonomuraea fuscirosea]|jgi:transcriptional regulator with XRE-family HTH domain|uniref:Transcriptional regulator with XRE-family HTH domain n=1 Tax=Nonomuraea fuscirosea TaxID=1291556 RepID=A0A2T0MWD6_9ACTN|nr:helix-turn-helix transcriptional regulator [Nonomuraea fuscirosea]PRX63263.1 transcriptional regulator with XRE-family HTH domain [Nonomuraea fuscirosea]WSA50735.1 helix-turn-helix transcriptional regulator [Nonomuraea fuscirosea]
MALPKVGSIGEYIRDQRQQAKISLRQLAAAAGVSNPYLSQIERGLRKPSAEILNQIAKGLRISSQALYVQAGLIEDREPPSDVITAIRADANLSERQRQVLIDIYESFLKERRAEDEQTSQNAHPRHDSDEDDAPLPEEFLAALEPYAATSRNGNVTQETKEG